MREGVEPDPSDPSEGTAPAPPKRVLVVDDDRDICHIIVEALADSGFAVECAYDGESALKLIKRRPFDIAVIDLVLAGVNGVSVARGCVAADVRVLMITGAIAFEQQLQGLKLTVLRKPFRLADLHREIRAALALPLPEKAFSG
jgi:two-component system, OmpR family, response regulator